MRTHVHPVATSMLPEHPCRQRCLFFRLESVPGGKFSRFLLLASAVERFPIQPFWFPVISDPPGPVPDLSLHGSAHVLRGHLSATSLRRNSGESWAAVCSVDSAIPSAPVCTKQTSKKPGDQPVRVERKYAHLLDT